MTLRLIGVCLILLLTRPALAVDYHVAGSQGNDAMDGRSVTAQGGSGPFATLRPLQSLRLAAGDRILLRCGERFAGPLKLNLALVTGGMVTIGASGECSRKPSIDGRAAPLPLAGVARQVVPATASVAQVFADGLPLPQARFPAMGLRLLPAGTGTGAAPDVIPDVAALGGRSLAGARLHARTQEWFVEERAVIDDAGHLGQPLRYPLRAKTGYQLSGKAWMLGDSPGWAWDASEGRLHVQSQPGSALAVVLEGPLLEVTGKGSLTIEGLAFDAAGGDAIRSALDGSVRISGVDIRRALGNGVSIAGARSAEVLASTIEDVGLDAVFFAEVRRVLVRDNVVRNAGLYAGLRPALAAINAHRTDAATVQGNLVERSAYHGIRFAGDAQVQGNVVLNACLLLSDCAGIYTWRRNADDRRALASVVGNIVAGVRGDTSVKLGVNDWFVGIYIDDFGNNALVTDNLVVGANQGIYLHNAWSVRVERNVVRAAQRPLIDASDPKKVPADGHNSNVLIDNDEARTDARLIFRDKTGQPASFRFGAALQAEIRQAQLPSAAARSAACRILPQSAAAAGAGLPAIDISECL